MLLLYSTMPTYCVGNSKVVFEPASKIIVPITDHLPILTCGKRLVNFHLGNRAPIAPHSILSPMTLGKEFSIFPIFNEKTGEKIYQFIPGENFKLPPDGGNEFLRQYAIYHEYAKNVYWPNLSSAEKILWNKPMYMLDFSNVSALHRGRMIDFFAGGGTLHNSLRFFDS